MLQHFRFHFIFQEEAFLTLVLMCVFMFVSVSAVRSGRHFWLKKQRSILWKPNRLHEPHYQLAITHTNPPSPKHTHTHTHPHTHDCTQRTVSRHQPYENKLYHINHIKPLLFLLFCLYLTVDLHSFQHPLFHLSFASSTHPVFYLSLALSHSLSLCFYPSFHPGVSPRWRIHVLGSLMKECA